jgi:hypothetical protein
MILGQIRDYLKQRGTISLKETAIHFDISEESASMALEYWVKKGKAHTLSSVSACGSSCGGCGDKPGKTHYQWKEQDIPIHWVKKAG